MSKVHWILQSNVDRAFDLRGMEALIHAGGHVTHIVELPREQPAPAISDLPDDAPIVCMGAGFLARVASLGRLRSGLFFNDETFCWSAFSAGWQKAMLSQEVRLLSLKDARAALAQTGPAFVRPDADSKKFNGGIYDAAGLEQATLKIEDQSLAVVVGKPVTVDREWRFFVVGQDIAACSQYMLSGKPFIDGHVPYRVIEFALDRAAEWQPAEIYCLDVGEENGRLGVIEANCFNASRFYHADPSRVIDAVSSFVSRPH